MALEKLLKNRPLVKRLRSQKREKVIKTSIDCKTTLDAVDLNNHLQLLVSQEYEIESSFRKGKTVTFYIYLSEE